VAVDWMVLVAGRIENAHWLPRLWTKISVKETKKNPKLKNWYILKFRD
jgi:hypothetical protein